jgi:ATP-dependent protease HslVU (ClpYQ) peptidase subunit
MTCIVGYIDKENDKIIMGGDSAGVAGLDIISRKDTKVFIKDNKFIMGFTTSFRMGQILHYMPLVIEEQASYEDDMSFMVKKFIPAVIELFKKNWGEMKNSNGEIKGGCFLVGYKNKLYQIESDYQVSENNLNYCSVGCGYSYAMSALKTLEDIDMSAKDKVLKSLEIAEFFSCGVRSPFNILEF